MGRFLASTLAGILVIIGGWLGWSESARVQDGLASAAGLVLPSSGESTARVEDPEGVPLSTTGTEPSPPCPFPGPATATGMDDVMTRLDAEPTLQGGDHGGSVVLADGRRLFVSSEIGGTVSVMDIAEDGTPTLVEKIGFEVAGVLPEWLQPVGVKVTADGSRIFVALGPANRVAVIDGESLEVLDYIIVGQRVWQLAFTPDQKYLLTTNGNSNDITVIDVAAEKAIKSVQVGQQPWGVVVTPD